MERGPVLRALEEAADAAVTGHGSLTFLAGEAGIGKTTVVNAFVALRPAQSGDYCAD